MICSSSLDLNLATMDRSDRYPQMKTTEAYRYSDIGLFWFGNGEVYRERRMIRKSLITINALALTGP